MRARGNYFPEIERQAAETLDAVSYRGGALSQSTLTAIVAHHGFTISYADDLPRSVRSVTDLRHRRIYLKQEPVGVHSPRTILLQTLGHFVLDHEPPRDFADFLRQRVEANYFAAAVLVPERPAARFLSEAMQARQLSVEDLRDVFSLQAGSTSGFWARRRRRLVRVPDAVPRVPGAGIQRLRAAAGLQR
jgi:predicted transcriptional regulator